ncbi:MAG: type II toxin-antitoxin system Phd/YefM family antitoxin [Candidatus Roizmanbacteria bacterium]|nr:type II toxin-antitoxin system Phd/YefM family antitoxin [Candidatus Roizmanbacteria bacterium]
MIQTINATSARSNFAEILNRVQFGGETIVIEKQGKAVAQIVSLPKKKQKKNKNLPPVFSMGGGNSTYRREEIYD